MWRGTDKSHPGGCVSVLRNVLRDLEPWKLSALARLGPLSHLNLDLIAIGKVVACNTEPSRGDLLDARPPIVQKALGILPSLASITTSPQRIHGFRQGLMCLAADGAERHGTSGEALDNLLCRLDLVQGHGTGGVELKLELATEGDLHILLVSDAGEFLVGLAGVSPCSNLQVGHTTRSIQMSLSPIPVMQLSIVLHQYRTDVVIVRVANMMQPFQIPIQGLEVCSLDPRCRARKAPVHDLVGESHRLEYLSPLVALQRRNAHLGHDFQ
mmetsp:Transcript_5181/g.9443  ORF Transcript_5181/g.9443 Transcript_5181/m.9443 type:complete len:269 (-) Transcript_5181:1853-2659(-)